MHAVQLRKTNITTINGDSYQSPRVGSITVEMPTSQQAHVHALVVGKQPKVGYISAPGSIVIKSSSEVTFCNTGWMCGGASAALLMVDMPNFTVQFNTALWIWTVTRKWENGKAPNSLSNTAVLQNHHTLMTC